MSFDFSRLPPESAEPVRAPSKILWAIVFLSLTGVGSAFVLYACPRQLSAHAMWFWLCVVVYPACISALIVSRRFSVYEGRRLDSSAWNDARKRYVERLYERASEPLFILDVAHVFIDDENNTSTAVANQHLLLKAQPSIAETGTITARWLKPREIDQSGWTRGPDAVRQEQVLSWVFKRLLEQISPALSKISSSAPITIKLHTSTSALRFEVETIWNEVWTSYRLPSAHVELITEPEISNVEAWLDKNDAVAKERAILLISVRLSKVLSENPPENSAEAGVALLLTYRDVLKECSVTPIARLHRPMEGDASSLSTALRYALRWGTKLPSSIGAVWRSGVTQESMATVHQAMDQTCVMSDRLNPLLEVDVERNVGDTEVVAPWLLVALATEMIQTSNDPQLVMIRQKQTFTMLVVAPHTS